MNIVPISMLNGVKYKFFPARPFLRANVHVSLRLRVWLRAVEWLTSRILSCSFAIQERFSFIFISTLHSLPLNTL